MDGENIQTIETEGGYLFMNDISSGFVVTHIENCGDTQDIDRIPMIKGLIGTKPLNTVAPTICTYNTEAYYLPLEIETKVVEGKGKIQAIEKTRKGEPITFKVTPDSGYKLSEVKVTDANGKTITFTNNTFTMPSANVTIEAIFVPDVINPVTADIAIISVISITLIFGVILIRSYKKKKWLK